MKFLRLKRHRTRRDGIRSVLPVVVEKARKFGRTLREEKISVRRDVLITGAHHSGKTRWLARLQAEAPGVWRGREVILIRCVNPLAAWVDDPRLIEHGEKASSRPWTQLRAWERLDALAAWVKEVRAVVLFDDAQLLTGRKLDVALRILAGARWVVVTASDEARLPISFRLALQRRRPQRINLKSEAPYDATALVVWLLSLAALGAGAWQLAAAIAGLNLLGRGRRAARQT